MGDPTPLDDRVRRSLSAAADAIDVSPDPTGSVAERAVRRRRRRRARWAGVAALGATAAVGIVAVGVGNDDDFIETSEERSEQDDAVDDTTQDAVATSPGSSAREAAVSAAAPARVAVSAAASLGYDVNQVLPWGDGFIALGYHREPQPLGPIPDEISALFPPEVLEVFPDGLPATIDEAMEILQEADLLDEVTAVMAEHPEAADAIYAAEAPEPRLLISSTIDGDAWTTIESDPPIEWAAFAVAGDRLIAWGTNQTADPAADGGLTIAATTDLIDWTVVAETAAAEPADERWRRQGAWVTGFAAIGDRWVAGVAANSWIDVEALLPPDVREAMQNSAGGGLGHGPDGVDGEYTTEDGEQVRFSYTWEELGLEAIPDDLVIEPETWLLVGEFGGSYERVPAPGDGPWGQVGRLGDEFLWFAEQASTSSDGRTWTAVEGLPAESFLNGVVPVDGGDLLVGGEGRAWLRADDGSISEVETPDLPQPYSLWNQSGTAAWVVPLEEFPAESFEPVTISVEHDGYEFRLTNEYAGAVWELRDLATGEVLRKDAIGPDTPGSDPFEYDEETGVAALVIDDEEGNEIVRIPADLYEAAAEEAYRSYDGPAMETEWTPDYWVIATADGVHWLVRDRDETEPTKSGPGELAWVPELAAANGDRVIYLTPDGWVVEPLPRD